MARDVFDKISLAIAEYLDYIKVVVMYHGGEPLLNKNLSDMIAQVKKLDSNIFVKIVSNGMLLNRQVINEIIDCGLDAIEISLDGTSVEENNMIRRGCDANVVINNIKDLIKCKKSKKITTPLIFLSSTQFQESDKDVKDPNFLYDAFKEELTNKDIEKIIVVRAMKWVDMNIIENVSEITDSSETTDSKKKYCDLIENTITIRWDGSVVPCCYDLTSKAVMGNILEKNIFDIWHGEYHDKLIKAIRGGNPIDICSKCNTINSPRYLILK